LGLPAANHEETLVTNAQQGDRGAFSELVCLHYTAVIQVAYHMCGNTQAAEDTAQETFLKAWQHLPDYRPQGQLRSWLYRITVNTALDMLRREAKLTPDDVDEMPLADGNPGPEAVVVANERAALVQQAVLTLPPASRAVLVLREYRGLSYQEIAETLDIPVGTVMSRLNYARSQLRIKLEPQLGLTEVKNG
jgi:RNA polymerase sigma-70 factor (ECF subfamily)